MENNNNNSTMEELGLVKPKEKPLKKLLSRQSSSSLPNVNFGFQNLYKRQATVQKAKTTKKEKQNVELTPTCEEKEENEISHNKRS